MKRLCLFGLFVLNVLLTFGQQTDFKNEIYIGFKGGQTFTKVRFYPNVIETSQQGNTAGVMFRLISEPHIGFQVELNYTQKGWKEDSLGYYRKLNYINIPIMTHVNLGSKAFRFTINLGPEVGFLLNENQGFTKSITISPSDPNNREYFGKKVDNQIDLLFTGGIGFEYHFKKGNALALDSRFFYSLPNLFDSKTYSFKTSQSNGLQVTLAYLFELNRKNKKRKL